MCCTVLLRLTAAFDTVDHEILRLEQWVGTRGLALAWCRSYVVDTTSVSVLVTLSSAPLFCGFSHGAILGLLLFILNLLPLGSILRKDGISFHCYVDNLQIYVPL